MDEFDDADVIKHINDCEKKIKEKAEELAKKINEGKEL